MRNARWQSRRPSYKAAAHVPNFDTLVPAPELSLADAKNNPFRKMRDTLRQLWSGNESVKIWYVSGSFVAGTSALSRGVPRHLLYLLLPFNLDFCPFKARPWILKSLNIYCTLPSAYLYWATTLLSFLSFGWGRREFPIWRWSADIIGFKEESLDSEVGAEFM